MIFQFKQSLNILSESTIIFLLDGKEKDDNQTVGLASRPLSG